jgi:hypothetical protein
MLAPNELVGLGRVELPTSPLSGVRSSHLSYRPAGVTSQRRKLLHVDALDFISIGKVLELRNLPFKDSLDSQAAGQSLAFLVCRDFSIGKIIVVY